MQVQVRKNNVTKAMNLLSKKLKEDGDLRRKKEKAYYDKPSAVRQKAKKQAQKRFKKSLTTRLGDDNMVTVKRQKRKSGKRAWEKRVRKDAS